MKLHAVVLLSFLVLAGLLAPARGETTRAQAVKQMSSGYTRDALATFQRLATDAKNDPAQVSGDLMNAINCLNRLGREDEIDALRDRVINAHSKNWRLLQTAASSYLYEQNSGFLISGKFFRGYHRGGGRQVSAVERDRVHALRLLRQALQLAGGHASGPEMGGLYGYLAAALRADRQIWQLQELTELGTLPDYADITYNYEPERGTPVDADGNPIYYPLPKSWNDAKNDGERWRWALAQQAQADPTTAAQVAYSLAGFCYSQYGEGTLTDYRSLFLDDGKTHAGGAYDVFTLKDDETIARLASGVKRFHLADEYNFIMLFQTAATGKGWVHNAALTALAQIYENRRQFDRAADFWRQAGNTERVKQILGNWGQFEQATPQPAGQAASVEFRFRNAKQVNFTAYPVHIETLLNDIKAYIDSKPRQLNWQKMEIDNLGYRLLQQDRGKYLGTPATTWSQSLTPRAHHFDTRVTIHTPLKQGGAYLLVGNLPGGNVSRILLWVADLAIVKKQLNDGAYYFIADAATGTPAAGATVDFFGYQNRWIENRRHRGGYNATFTRHFTKTADADGQVILPAKTQNSSYQWLITSSANGRFAYLGYTNVWFHGYYDQAYYAQKTYIITDRPVYRPAQTVKFKCWVAQTKYDQVGKCPYAGQAFTLSIYNPRGQQLFQKEYTADEFGGIDGECTLPKDAVLGEYGIGIDNAPEGEGSFRVEEYKKPEYEVTIDAPEKPVMLGEKITATIKAKYYFGAPVTNAKVKYKVQRTNYSGAWYPVDRWDWFYGPGYWWFAGDYPWYPGWYEWGCRRPAQTWWDTYRGEEAPEVVASAEAPIGPDGTVKVEIDTALAKELYGDTDHRYEITAEVTDKSRRTITGQGVVLAARKPFKVYAWVDRGYYRVGDTVLAEFSAQTLDNRPVPGMGKVRLFKVSYPESQPGNTGTARMPALPGPEEKEVQWWNLNSDEQGQARLQIKAEEAGQYRLSYTVVDAQNHVIEGAYLFDVMGEGKAGTQYRFNDLELAPDKRTYQPGEQVKLMVGTNRITSTVLLFLRPANGVYLPPKVLHIQSRIDLEKIDVLKKDMPNFFIEALTISNGKVHTEMREIAVPPEKRIVNVAVEPSAQKYKPGEKANIALKVTNVDGSPFHGSTVVSLYDKAVEYISGGASVPDIKTFFWQWRRDHRPNTESSLARSEGNIVQRNQDAMWELGNNGAYIANGMAYDGNGRVELASVHSARLTSHAGALYVNAHMAMDMACTTPAPMAACAPPMRLAKDARVALEYIPMNGQKAPELPRSSGQPGALVEPTVRSNFADTAFWTGSLNTDAEGKAQVSVTMPENLTTWKARVWAMGDGTKVGEGTAEVVTTKNLLIRLEAPRFFVQKDEVVLSAIVHNYLTAKKSVQVALEMEGDCASIPADQGEGYIVANHTVKAARTVDVDANGEQHVDWRVHIEQPGTLTVRMKALTDEESDAMQMHFPVYIHGMLKTDSFSGVIRPEKTEGTITLTVPVERLPEQSRLEVRYSPTLAGAMVDALPYLVDYPYGCTEQTLNRFLPTVLTQHALLKMGVSLQDIQKKRSNLNAQEIGDDAQRAADWKRNNPPNPGDDDVRNPVFDEATVRHMVSAGIERLGSMQCADGGWGWFSGYGEQSYPHTTALVVHGLQLARANGADVPQDMLARGIAWLRQYQTEQVRLLKLPKTDPMYKPQADALDALIYMVLVDQQHDNTVMRAFLYRDRLDLPIYARCMFGIALHRVGDIAERDAIIKTVDQYLVQDDEDQTAYLRLPENNWWWYWYGSEYEAQGYYLKLLSLTEPHGQKASRLVKYLLNNRKHATYWNSTRDTAVVVEAFADYLKASGESQPEMTLEVQMDGQTVKTVKIDKSNLFSFDNKFILDGEKVTPGAHTVKLVKHGTGPVYFNAYLTNFTLEDPITRTGLEIKVNRKFYHLTPVKATNNAEGSRGQLVAQQVEKYTRTELPDLATVKSGDLVEVELSIDSKNDYEYILFEDMKAAGFEPVEVQSGYNGNEMGAYVEFHDERVCFFVRHLARGNHSVSYRLRAETPGMFSALPTKASAMYAPELKANSDEGKLGVKD